jgi:hypothetical protein
MSNLQTKQAESGKKLTPRLLVVDDVLVNTWGYEQTNVDYYQVTALIGKSSVEIRSIAKDSIETGSMVGVCTPILGHFLNNPMRKRVIDGYCVRMDYGSASRKDYQLTEGKKTFKPDRWSSYG